MSLIMDISGLEQSELSFLELENLPYLTFFTFYVERGVGVMSSMRRYSFFLSSLLTNRDDSLQRE